MRVKPADRIRQNIESTELKRILRTCVHCGFCNAVCPTYQLKGNELDGPRGRIYLMKQMLEGREVSSVTQQHLDKCLSCRSCETACPSGVRYTRLLDLCRVRIDEIVRRSFSDRILRYFMRHIFPFGSRFRKLMTVSRWIRPILPSSVRDKIPVQLVQDDWPNSSHSRKMLILKMCVQPVLAPSIDDAAARVLDKLGISLIPVENSGCCGALNYHLSDHLQCREMARKNIDACWPYIEKGAEAIVMTASGCGVTAKEYEWILKDDAEYRKKARCFSALVKDISEILTAEDLTGFTAGKDTVAFQSPCTLQHGLKLAGSVESILHRIGFNLTEVRDRDTCCGSSGVYSILQADTAERLKNKKLQGLQIGKPDIIATANIGCMTHLQSGSPVRIVHWIELLQ